VQAVDPVTVGAVLLAIVSGAAGEAGSRLWAGVSALVRRPFRHRGPDDSAISLRSGDAELKALEEAPSDQARARALAEVLVARGDADADFGRGLQEWWAQASQVRTGEGNVTNTISGGTQNGPVLQGRDFNGPITFGSAPPPPPPAAK
jgi:hypothetical protein